MEISHENKQIPKILKDSQKPLRVDTLTGDCCYWCHVHKREPKARQGAHHAGHSSSAVQSKFMRQSSPDIGAVQRGEAGNAHRSCLQPLLIKNSGIELAAFNWILFGDCLARGRTCKPV